MTTGAENKPEPFATFARCALVAGVTAVVLAGLGYLPTVRLAGDGALPAMLIGIGAALVGAWAGSLMPVLFISRDPRVFFNGILLNLGVRFFGTIALALLLRAMGVGPVKPFLLWVGIGQVVLLASDMIMLLRLVRELTPTWEGKA
jgi:hypothetical protein